MNRFFVLVLLTLVPAVAPAAEPVWQAGFASVVITPANPMWMSGYASRTAPAEGKATDLYAKAAVLKPADGPTLVLVTLDLVGIDRELSKAICDAIGKKHKVPRESIAVCCSHTHCGPVVGATLRSMYFLDERNEKLVADYTFNLPNQVMQAVDDAVANLAAVTLTRGVGKCEFAVNRRENKEADVPDLKRQGKLKGPVDHDVPVLAARGSDGKLRGVLFGYACHATTLSYQKWNGDYPGYAMAAVEKANPGAVAVFVAGCGADQNPLPRRSVELAQGYGKQLAAAVQTVLEKPMTAVKPTSAATFKEIDLPLNAIPSREQLLKESTDANKYVAARGKMLLKKLDDEKSLPATVPYPIQTWRLGSLSWVLLGGEVVVDYSLRLKSADNWVSGYANDVMAYIPSARVLKEGGYEGSGAMVYYGLPSAWGGTVEQLIVDEVKRQGK
jgi:neutral ceramidase